MTGKLHGSKIKEYYACTRKEGYLKPEAEERLVQRYLSKGRAGSIYRCTYCGWYHITKQVNRRKP